MGCTGRSYAGGRWIEPEKRKKNKTFETSETSETIETIETIETCVSVATGPCFENRGEIHLGKLSGISESTD